VGPRLKRIEENGKGPRGRGKAKVRELNFSLALKAQRIKGSRGGNNLFQTDKETLERLLGTRREEIPGVGEGAGSYQSLQIPVRGDVERKRT